ncbi:MAG: hypothetical protein HUJ76_10775 [Parasporobacterium sp.]|nr:hypothetical protein [Parasporobacterium sp.]
MKIYSPWAQVDCSEPVVLNPRLDTLSGKTIGLYAHFKGHSPVMLQILSELLAERFPDTKFKAIQLKRDTKEAFNIPEFDAELKEWLKDVDGVITAYGDAGSCCMFHAYNTVYIEKLGKPAVMLCKEDLLGVGKKAATTRLCPHLRFVTTPIFDLTWVPELDEGVREGIIRPNLRNVLDNIVDGLCRPLTHEEKTPFVKDNSFADSFEVDSLENISDLFYANGWTTGLPINPPTEEAVKEMMRGTDLPADYVVAKIPPMMGKATVEKIAVNAVMAGCKPTYMPVLIAAVKAIVDPKIALEGWTCSVASWCPVITVSGKVAAQIGVGSGCASLSQYQKANAAISRAYAYIIQNISGVRPGTEDMAEVGHEGRMGITIADQPSDINPFVDPVHVDFGLDKDDSAVTMFWAQERYEGHGGNAPSCFKSMFRAAYGGWDRGCCYVMSPGFARNLIRSGYTTRKEILRYVQQYARHSAANVNFRWMHDNNHIPEGVLIPLTKDESAPLFWTTDHMMIVVSGSNYDATCINFAGGGEHGGPACVKIELPADWDELLKDYPVIQPEYHIY